MRSRGVAATGKRASGARRGRAASERMPQCSERGDRGDTKQRSSHSRFVITPDSEAREHSERCGTLNQRRPIHVQPKSALMPQYLSQPTGSLQTAHCVRLQHPSSCVEGTMSTLTYVHNDILFPCGDDETTVGVAPWVGEDAAVLGRRSPRGRRAATSVAAWRFAQHAACTTHADTRCALWRASRFRRRTYVAHAVSARSGRCGDRRRLCQEDAGYANHGLGDRTGAATTVRSRDPIGGMTDAEGKAVGVGGAGVGRRIGG